MSQQKHIKRLSIRLVKTALLIGSTALLLACASKVSLNDPAKVEDRNGGGQEILVQGGGAGSGGGALNPRDVRPIDLTGGQTDATGKVLYFDFDSYSVKPQFQGLIEAQAKRLNADRTAKLAVSGHTDEIGGREYNLALGQKRAEAVKRALSLLGVQESQLEAVSFGKEKPASAEAGEAAAALNRRAELVAR